MVAHHKRLLPNGRTWRIAQACDKSAHWVWRGRGDGSGWCRIPQKLHGDKFAFMRRIAREFDLAAWQVEYWIVNPPKRVLHFRLESIYIISTRTGRSGQAQVSEEM